MKKIILRSILTLPLVFMIVLFHSCGEIPPVVINQPPVTDSNVYIYDSLDITSYINQSFPSCVDLLNGLVMNSTDTNRDIQLSDSAGSMRNFYFTAGSISLPDSLGRDVLFDMPFATLTKIEFDTLSRIIAWDPVIDSTDFSSDVTSGFGYMNIPLTQNPVYGFYLQGKFADGYTANRVYGIMRVNTFVDGPVEKKMNISVKINTAGFNKFVK